MLQANISFDQSYGNDAHQAVDVIVPHGIESPHLIVCLHAGWWTSGRQSDLRPCMIALAKMGYAVASVGYRLLSSSVHGSDIMDDVMSGIAIASEEAALLGAEERSSCLLGSGAGGLLAVNAALRSPHAFSTVVTCGATPSLTAWENCPAHISKALAAFGNTQSEKLDPLRCDLSQLPPIHIMHGDSDPEVPASQARELHVAAINADRESTFSVLTGTQHHFIENPHDRNAQSAYTRIDSWLHSIHHESHALVSGEAPFMA